MNRLRLSLIGLALGLGLAACGPAQEPPTVPSATPVQVRPEVSPQIARLIPPKSQRPSPVALFRQLLNLSARERESYLTNRPPAVQVALLAKIKEYLAMDPDARELRLRATELRWQLMPLLRTAPADRAEPLALVPEDLAPLVQSRLTEWDKLSPTLQQEFLANDRAISYFAVLDTTNQTVAETAADAERQKIAARFNQFFELTPDEKQRTLKTLSAAERAQMENTLQAFDKLPAPQRQRCLRAFEKFKKLSPAEQAEFLKNAGLWAQMTPQERQTWRDLVARVPNWPPVPPSLIMPPAPPRIAPVPRSHPVVATNRN
jgi:hypothetical protein